MSDEYMTDSEYICLLRKVFEGDKEAMGTLLHWGVKLFTEMDNFERDKLRISKSNMLIKGMLKSAEERFEQLEKILHKNRCHPEYEYFTVSLDDVLSDWSDWDLNEEAGRGELRMRKS